MFKIKKNESKSTINSILIGLLVSINMLTKLFTSLINIPNNILIVVALILSISIIFNRLKINYTVINFTMITLIFFGISLIKLNANENTVSYLTMFLLYGFTSFYLLSQKYNSIVIIKTVNIVFCVFSLLLLPIYINKIQNGLISIDFTMDLSYTLLVGIVATIIIMIFYRPKKFLYGLFNILILLYNFYYLFFINANRGVFLALAMFFVLTIVVKFNNIAIKRFLVFLLASLGFLAFNNMEHILGMLNGFLIHFNINSSLISKIIFQYNNDVFTSNREAIWGNSLELIKVSPILGNGIGALESIHGYYAHNFVLQIFIEFGLLFGFAIMILIGYGIYKIYKTDNYTEEIVLLIFFFCISIPRLLVSETYWNIPAFWMYLFLTYKLLKLKSKKSDRINSDIREIRL